MSKGVQLGYIIAFLTAVLLIIVGLGSCGSSSTDREEIMQRRIAHCRQLGGQPYLEVRFDDFFMSGCLLK